MASLSAFGGFQPGGGTIVRSSKTSFVFFIYLCHPLEGMLGEKGAGDCCCGDDLKK
jgi:hypothetical protein